jgi:hypothetical protein
MNWVLLPWVKRVAWMAVVYALAKSKRASTRRPRAIDSRSMLGTLHRPQYYFDLTYIIIHNPSKPQRTGFEP